MTKDQLYLLKPAFYDGDQGPFFCPGCVEVFGVLESHPPLKETVEIHFVDFARPRLELVPLLGEAHQSCPVLVLADASKRRRIANTPTGEVSSTTRVPSPITGLSPMARRAPTERPIQPFFRCPPETSSASVCWVGLS